MSAHLLGAGEGVIEAGDIGHDGLLIWPQRAHDVYTHHSRRERGGRERSRERERERSREREREIERGWRRERERREAVKLSDP